MPDEVGQEFTTEEVVDNSQTQTETAQTETEGGYNPAWEPLRQSLGLQFEAIKPELAKIDKDFHSHVEKVNGQYAPWKSLAEQGITPDAATQALAVIQQMNQDPVGLYQRLHQFLQDNGRLPNTAEATQIAEEAADDETQYESEADRRIAEMQKRLDDFQRLQEQQAQQAQQAELERRADQEVKAEYDAFKAAHPDLSEDDWVEIQKRHYAYAAMGAEHIRSLEDVGKEYFDLVNRIRSAPRPNDLAPRLPGAGGAAPAPQTKDPSQFSREESVDALTEALLRAKQNQ